MVAPVVIDITYPDTRLAENRARQEAMWARRYHDRVPVWLGLYARYLLPRRGFTYRDYWAGPRDHLIHQLEHFKWIVENVDDDRWAGGEILLVPDFENVPNSAAMGCEIGWMDEDPPRAFPCLTSPEQAEAFVPPRPTEGFWGKMLAWQAEMNDLLARGQVRVTRNGRPLKVHVTMGAYSLGPFSIAVDMAGADWYEWLLLYPEACAALLAKITGALIEMEAYCRNLDSSRVGGYNLAEDSAQIISPALFRRFCAPYARRLYAAFPGERSMHMCGRNLHLHRSLLQDTGMTYLSGFGAAVTPEETAATLGGRALLRGNVDCVLLKEGTPAQVRAAVRRCLEALAPFGGYIVSDGFNIAPGTPVENLWAMKQEVAEFGRPQIQAVGMTRELETGSGPIAGKEEIPEIARVHPLNDGPNS